MPQKDAAEGLVGSCYQIAYNDGATWTIRITGICDRTRCLCYEVSEASPAMHVTSMQAKIKLHSVTDDDTTFMEWVSDFANDADL